MTHIKCLAVTQWGRGGENAKLCNRPATSTDEYGTWCKRHAPSKPSKKEWHCDHYDRAKHIEEQRVKELELALEKQNKYEERVREWAPLVDAFFRSLRPEGPGTFLEALKRTLQSCEPFWVTPRYNIDFEWDKPHPNPLIAAQIEGEIKREGRCFHRALSTVPRKGDTLLLTFMGFLDVGFLEVKVVDVAITPGGAWCRIDFRDEELV